MAESQTDYDIQKICNLEARMRNIDARVSQPPIHPPKKIEPCQLTPIEAKQDAEPKDNFDSIDLKTNQKLKELSSYADQDKGTVDGGLQGKKDNIKKIGSESRRFVKRKLDVDFDPLRKQKIMGYDEKGGSDNSNEGANFHHTSIINNNTKITDYFEVRLNRKPTENGAEKKILDFKSILPKKEKIEKNPIISMYTKKNINNEKKITDIEKALEDNKDEVPDFVNENLKLKEDIRKLNKKIVDKDSQINEGNVHFNDLIQENRNLQENVKYYEDYLSVI